MANVTKIILNKTQPIQHEEVKPANQWLRFRNIFKKKPTKLYKRVDRYIQYNIFVENV